MKLLSEAIDIDKEKRRLEAYSKYRPVFVFGNDPNVLEDDFPKNRYHSEWKTIIYAEVCSFTAEDFFQVMKVWINEPNKIFPPIKSGKISSDDEAKLDDFLNKSHQTQGIYDGAGEVSFEIFRELIPKRADKDSQLTELVKVSRDNKGVSVEFRHSIEDTKDLPFYYPKVRKYQWSYTHIEEKQDNRFKALLSLQVVEFSLNSSVKGQYGGIWKDLFLKLYKWCVTQNIGINRRAEHNVMVNKERYEEIYGSLKAKYGKDLVSRWTEKTDPKKFVYEDIAIASWLIGMWEKDDKESKSNSLEQNQQEGGEGVERPYFVDVGCGNGLLVYILNSEGYPGYGVDQASRKIWKTITGMNKEDCPQANLCGHTLIEQDVIPYEYTTNARWLIGNHPDELTPWMPIIAAKSDFANCVIIPCCYYNFQGNRIQPNHHGDNKPRQAGESKYAVYCEYVCRIMNDMGYDVHRDFLRIPSTRNIALIGYHPGFQNEKEKQAALSKADTEYCERYKKDFKLRIPDRLK